MRLIDLMVYSVILVSQHIQLQLTQTVVAGWYFQLATLPRFLCILARAPAEDDQSIYVSWFMRAMSMRMTMRLIRLLLYAILSVCLSSSSSVTVNPDHLYLRILFQNCSIFRFRCPSSQLWHPSFSPLYDVLNLTTHIFSESLWHVLFTDAPVMTMKKTQANTKTKTKTMTKTKWLKDLACAIFLKMIWLKDIISDDESVMHH